MNIFFTYFLYFFIYSVLGWMAEMLYCRLLDGKWTNRGFLSGPYCPIYGFGSLLIISFLDNFISSPIAVFFLGMIFTSTLEYISSFILEKLFNAKWWDYSKRKFNINGRICLLNSLEFAILGILLTYFIHPAISKVILNTPIELQELIAISLITILAIDTGFTVATLLNLKERLATLKESAEQFKNKASTYGKVTDLQVYKELSELRKNIVNRRNHQIERLLNAFPDFEFKDFKTQINEFKLEINKLKRDIQEQKDKRKKAKLNKKREKDKVKQ